MKSCNPCSCSGAAPRPGGFLVQQIQGSGRTYLRYQRFTLCLSCPPSQACPPLRLTQVSAVCEAPPCELTEPACGCGFSLRVHVPLCCTLCDDCGGSYSVPSFLDVQLPLRTCGACDLRRCQLSVNAQVRLARACGCVEGGQADAYLDVCLEAWATVLRPVFPDSCPPPGLPAPLPLYPQPFRPR